MSRLLSVRAMRQHFRIALAADQGGQHGPSRDTEDVAGHHRQLYAGVFQQLLGPRCFSAVRAGTRSIR